MHGSAILHSVQSHPTSCYNNLTSKITLTKLFPTKRVYFLHRLKMTTDTEMSASLVKDDKAIYEEKVKRCSVIAKPMASRKLAKKIYKLIKKAITDKNYCRNGLKDVQMRIRKGETGIVVFAGDVTPVDIMCHLPGVCEDNNIPYCYIPSRADLGAALGVKRGTLMVLIRERQDYQAEFNELKEEIKHLAVVL